MPSCASPSSSESAPGADGAAAAQPPPPIYSEEDLGRSLEAALDLQPPPLTHQGRTSCASLALSDEVSDEEPRWRSLAQYDSEEDVLAAPGVYRSATLGSDASGDEFPVYRSVSLHDLASPPHLPRWQRNSDAATDPFAPHVHKSPSSTAHAGFLPASAHAYGAAGSLLEVPQYRSFSWSSLSAELAQFHAVAEPQAADAAACGCSSPTRSFAFELPSDVFDAVLGLLPACPDLFSAMGVSRAWRDATRANYLARVVSVPPTPDALLRAVAGARAGDTVRLQPGVHMLSSELTVERPLRVLSDFEADAALGKWRAGHTAPDGTAHEPQRRQQQQQPASGEGGGGGSGGSGAVVLVGTLHVLLRTRCTALVAGVTLCRMGDEVGYPNAVTYAEAGLLRMARCRVTCGGAAASVSQALQAFAGAPEPGTVWLTRQQQGPHRLGRVGDLRRGMPAHATAGSAAGPSSGGGHGVGVAAEAAEAAAAVGDAEGEGGNADGEGGGGSRGGEYIERATSPLGGGESFGPLAPLPPDQSQCPQSGVWVGAAASVELHGCTIAACMGPGVKIYRGRLLAQRNTIAFSSRGANVVANGGHVWLEGNEIQGANGDGVSSWNNSVMHIESNSIHANSGAGIAVNTGGGSVTISNNAVFDNACQAITFAASAKQATMRDNDFEGSSAKAAARTGGGLAAADATSPPHGREAAAASSSASASAPTAAPESPPPLPPPPPPPAPPPASAMAWPMGVPISRDASRTSSRHSSGKNLLSTAAP